MLNGLLRDLPVEDLESMFEMLSALSHDTMDDGTRLLLLECLQTFVPWRKPTKNDDHTLISSDIIAAERGYCLFDTQQALDKHISAICSAYQTSPPKPKAFTAAPEPGKGQPNLNPVI